jgi:transcriptional regulator with XRE-family HTH domain
MSSQIVVAKNAAVDHFADDLALQRADFEATLRDTFDCSDYWHGKTLTDQNGRYANHIFMSTEKLDSHKEKSRVAILLEKLDLTQDEFAARLGISQGVVANWVTGKHQPSRPAIAAIAREFRVEEDWLTKGHEPIYKQAGSEFAAAWNEAPEMYTNDPKRIELLIKVKKLIVTGDDGTIDALLSNVEKFQDGVDARRELEELKKK